MDDDREVKHSMDSRIVNARNIQRERYLRWKKERDDEHAAILKEQKWRDDLSARGISAADQEFLSEIRKENKENSNDLTTPSTSPNFLVTVHTACGNTLRIDVQSLFTYWDDDEEGLDHTGIISFPNHPIYILQQPEVDKARRVYDLFRDDREIVPISCRLSLIIHQATVEELEAKDNLAKRQKLAWSEDNMLTLVGDYRVALPTDIERNILHNVDLPIVFVEIVIQKYYGDTVSYDTYYAYPANPDVRAPDNHIVFSEALSKLIAADGGASRRSDVVRIRLVDLPKPPPSSQVCADIRVKNGGDQAEMTALLQKQRLLFTNQIISNSATSMHCQILRLHSSTGKLARAVNTFGNVDIGIMPYDDNTLTQPLF